jgi:hypothetical protein
MDSYVKTSIEQAMMQFLRTHAIDTKCNVCGKKIKYLKNTNFELVLPGGYTVICKFDKNCTSHQDIQEYAVCNNCIK